MTEAQTTVAKAAPIKRSRSKENEKYANDGSYESVRLLIEKLARKAYTRAVSMGVYGFEYEDILQEMNLTYVKCLSGWNNNRGVLFSTYLTTACYHNFGNMFRESERSRKHLGMLKFSDLTDSEDSHKMQDYLSNQSSEVEDFYHSVEFEGECLTEPVFSMAMPIGADPCATLEAAQEFSAWAELYKSKVEAMTEPAKQIVSDLIDASKRPPISRKSKKVPSLLTLSRRREMPFAESKRVKLEIAKTFEVDIGVDE
jgi:DNA-directed RNA polymerase specialized sigma24 family protein